MNVRGSEMMRRFRALDAALVAKGFPPTSPWWLETLDKFYASGRRNLVVRAGRRAGKSSTLCRVAVVECLYGGHKIPPGDVGTVMFVGAKRDEATKRLFTIEAILRAISVPFNRSGDAIDVPGLPYRFEVFTASIAGVSGPTAIMVIGDEVSKWIDKDTGANPAKEVLASARPTMATVASARMILSSSPFGTLDAHYEAFERGDTPNQLVAYAPSWLANPTLTEEGTRADEPDERVWRREYLAEPQAAVSGAFDPEAIERAFRSMAFTRKGRRQLVLDPSSGRKDAWTWGAVGWSWAPQVDRPFLQFDFVDALGGSFWRSTSGEEIVARLATLASGQNIGRVIADQREAMMLQSAFNRHGLAYVSIDWTNGRKVEAVARLRRWFADGLIVLPAHEKLKRELLSFEERITNTGALTYQARGSGHDDHVALLLTAAMADSEGYISRTKPSDQQPQAFEPHYVPPSLAAWGGTWNPSAGYADTNEGWQSIPTPILKGQ